MSNILPMSVSLQDGVHVYPVRVYYEDTDASGIVYYANYLRFAERARTELLRDIGAAHEYIKAHHGVEFIVKNFAADYLQPAFLDDALVVQTTRSQARGASITLRQAVGREGQELVVMQVKIAARDQKTGRAAGIPSDVRAAFEQLTEEGRDV